MGCNWHLAPGFAFVATSRPTGILLGNVAGRQVSERDCRSKRDSRARIGPRHDAGGVVPDGVETLNGLAIRVQDPRRIVGLDSGE